MSTITNTAVSPITPEEVVRQLRALRELIPDFTLQSREEIRPLVSAASVDPELIHESINAIAASPQLQNALGRDAESLRGEHELLGRWSEVVVEVDAFRRGVKGAIRVRGHRLGGTVLQARLMSRQLVRYRENANLLPHLDAMNRAARAAKRRARATPALPPAVASTDVKPAR